jgi:hypothetical protein
MIFGRLFGRILFTGLMLFSTRASAQYPLGEPYASYKGLDVHYYSPANGVALNQVTSTSTNFNYLMMSTPGTQYFHIGYRPNFVGFMVFTRKPETQELIVRSHLFGALPGTMKDNGVLIDLRSPYQVLQFDRYETQAKLAFKILEFTIEPIYDNQATRYLRVFVSENKDEIFPLDISHQPMSEISKVPEVLKSRFVQIRTSGAATSIQLAVQNGLEIQIQAGKSQILLNGRPATPDEAYRHFGPLQGRLSQTEVAPKQEDLQRIINARREAAHNALADGSFPGIKRFDDRAPKKTTGALMIFEHFKPKEGRKYFVESDELQPFKQAPAIQLLPFHHWKPGNGRPDLSVPLDPGYL